MLILTYLIATLAGIIALLLVVALFSKKDYSIFRSMIINRPQKEVFEYIRHLKNQDQYSKWVMTDPNMKREFKGTDGTVGFVYAWDGNKKAGKGEQEITKLVEGEQVDIEVRFEKPFEGKALTPFTIESSGDNQTKVTWGTNSTMKYPMNIMITLLNLEGMLGKDIEASLANLKRILEEK